MSKHIPLPLERRGTMVYSQNACTSCATFICQCRTAEQADEIIAALEMHTPMKEALVSFGRVMALIGEEPVNVADHCALQDCHEKAVAALKYPPKKETTP